MSNVVLFQGIDSSGNGGLWETNGTVAGTFELSGIAGAASVGLYPVDLAPVNANEAVFGGEDASGLVGLWETDGTAAGTHELTSIAGAATTAIGLYPNNFTPYGSEIMFSGYDATGNIGLWVSDGTAAGTQELTGIVGAATTGVGLFPYGLTVYNGKILFSGYDTTGGIGLWVSDGTAAGTYELAVAGAWTTAQGASTTGGLTPYDLTVYDGLVFFDGRDSSGQLGLWETDGTASSTKELTGIVGAAPTGLDPSDLTVFSGHVLFSGLDSSGQIGLWETDGTVAGTHELTGVVGAASTGLNPSDLTVFNGYLLFSGLDSSGQTGLWETDGTAAGTHELTGIVGASTVNFAPSGLTAITTVSSAPDWNILWQNTNGQVAIWDVNGSTRTGGGAVGPNPGRTWRAVGTGSFYGGDTSDILWQNTSTGQVSVWEMDGSTRTGGGTVSANPGTSWKAVGTGDFTDNGFFDDILFQNKSTGQASIWEMEGNTRTGGGAVSVNPGTSWKAVGTGDFTDDGFSDDILWQNTSTGQVSIWEMDGNTRTGGRAVSINPGPAWHAIGTGDFYGAGDSDILWQNGSTGQLSIWEMDGNTRIGGGAVSVNPGPAWHAIGTGGGSDILFQNTSTGQISIWEMDGTTRTGGGAVSPNPGPSWHAIDT